MHVAMEDLVEVAIHLATASILVPAIAGLFLLPGAYRGYYGKEKHQTLRLLPPASWLAAPNLYYYVLHLNCLMSQAVPRFLSSSDPFHSNSKIFPLNQPLLYYCY